MVKQIILYSIKIKNSPIIFCHARWLPPFSTCCLSYPSFFLTEPLEEPKKKAVKTVIAGVRIEKFKPHLRTKLLNKEVWGDSIDEVVGICTEIFSTFLHSEYGGPGTLLVIPFIDMADTINERGLAQAARVAVKPMLTSIANSGPQVTAINITPH